jgi:hypothetical protein
MPSSPEWFARYDAAKRLLLDGRFPEAVDALAALSRTAANPHDALLAGELWGLAVEWAKRDTKLVSGRALEESGLRAKNDDRRTTGEIAGLYISAVVYGLGTGGFISVQTDARTPAAAILPALVTAGGAVGLVALIDSGKGLGYGVPQSIGTGMYLGLGEGLLWTLWNQARVGYSSEWSDKTVASVVWAATTIGAIGGGVLGTEFGATPGRASYVASASLWASAVFGLSAAALHANDDHWDDAALLSAALGLNAGLGVGLVTAGSVAPSVARVRFLDLGALSGGVLLGGLALSAMNRNDPDGHTAMGLTALGIAGGVGVAWALTNGMPKDQLPEKRLTTGAPVPLGLTVAPVNGGATLAAYGLL